MIEPTQEQIAEAKAETAKLFGHDRIIGVDFAHPVTDEPLVCVLISDMTVPEARAYYDACIDQRVNARNEMLAARVRWPAGKVLEPLREEWASFDFKIEEQYREEAGFVPLNFMLEAQRLSRDSRPKALSPEKAAQLLAENPGRLWWAEYQGNGFAIVMRQPHTDIWTMGSTKLGEAINEKKGVLDALVGIAGDHTIWTATGASLAEHIAEKPGRAALLQGPWTVIGGATARTSARRF